MMNKIRDNNYINIQGWMVTKLGLSGNDLLVYAIIYGFSQDDGSMFTGSLQYLADWCNATKQGIQKNLNKLVKNGYIQKEEYYENKVKFCNYYATPPGGMQQSCIGVCNKVAQGMQQSCINKLEDKLEKNITISKDMEDTDTNTTDNTSVIPIEKSQKKKKSRYEQFIDIVDGYTENEELREVLKDHIKLCLEMAKEKPMFANQYKGMLKKLTSYSNDENIRIKIVRQSIECGWLSFYELKDNKSFSGKNKPNAGLQMREVDAKSLEDSKAGKEFTEKLKREAEQSGRRAVF